MTVAECRATRCSHFYATDEPTLCMTQQEGFVRDDGTIHWLPVAHEPTCYVGASWREHLINSRGGAFDADGWYVYPGTTDSQRWRLRWDEVAS